MWLKRESKQKATSLKSKLEEDDEERDVKEISFPNEHIFVIDVGLSLMVMVLDVFLLCAID